MNTPFVTTPCPASSRLWLKQLVHRANQLLFSPPRVKKIDVERNVWRFPLDDTAQRSVRCLAEIAVLWASVAKGTGSNVGAKELSGNAVSVNM